MRVGSARSGGRRWTQFKHIVQNSQLIKRIPQTRRTLTASPCCLSSPNLSFLWWNMWIRGIQFRVTLRKIKLLFNTHTFESFCFSHSSKQTSKNKNKNCLSSVSGREWTACNVKMAPWRGLLWKLILAYACCVMSRLYSEIFFLARQNFWLHLF